MKIEGDELIFSTGKALNANRGIVGIGPNDDQITEGYDSGLYDPEEDWEDEPARLTPDECKELADYMVARWAEWGRKWSTQ